MTGIFCLYATARTAMALYFARLLLRIGLPADDRRDRWARCLWIAACVFYDVHVLLAFAFPYHWSHATAVERTAMRTEEVLGTPSGEGIYVSYFFTLLWTVDALWSIVARQSYDRRPRAVARFVEGFAAFMVFMAVVVFAEPMMRYVGGSTIAVLIVVAVVRRRRPA